MAKSFTDIRRSRDYWSFLNALAEQEEKRQPLDQTVSKVFADFLEENGDARHVLARAATHFYPSSLPGAGVPHSPRQILAPMFRGATSYGFRTWPVAAYQENAHSYVDLWAHGPNPVLHWHVHIPKTVSTRVNRDWPVNAAEPVERTVSRTARLTAPVTVAELHSFIDAMPNSAAKVKWRQVAEQNGWKNPTAPLPPSGQESPEMTAVLGPKPPRKLARDSNRDPLIHTMAEQEYWDGTVDNTNRLAFADHLEETQTPGAHIVRAHVAKTQSMPLTVIEHHGDSEYTLHALHNQYFPGEQYPTFGVGVVHHDSDSVWNEPTGSVSHEAPVTSARHAFNLLSDFPHEAKRKIVRALMRVGLPANDPAPTKLAREDKKKIGARIRALIASGMDRKKAVKQAVRECRVKLARAGTDTEQALLAAIDQNPHDRTPWLVYADHLDEADRPAEAARIRWWQGARAKIHDALNASTRQRGGYSEAARLFEKLPPWIAGLIGVEAGRHHIKNPVRLTRAVHIAAEQHLLGVGAKRVNDRLKKYPANEYSVLPGQANADWHERHEQNHRHWLVQAITENLYRREPDAGDLATRYAGHHAVSNPGGSDMHPWQDNHTIAQAVHDYMAESPPPTEEPAKLARVEPHARAGLAGSTRASMTDSHESRLQLARQIVHEAGLSPATVRAAIAASNGQTRPSAVIAVRNSTEPEHAAYAAAWYGMLAGEPSMMVFQPGEGPHYLHIMDSPHPTEHVVNYLSKAGVPSFTVERRGPGSRVYAVSTDTTFDPWQLARGLDARHSRIAGSATRVGGSSDTASDPGASSRAAYRDAIRATERRAFASASPSTGPTN